MQSGKQRARLGLKRPISDLCDAAGYSHPMQLFECKGLQYQQVERTLQKLGLRGKHAGLL
jgi:hypothetical protein